MESTKNVSNDGTIYYTNNKGNIHREDGPSYIKTDGYMSWHINGLAHREDGPAIINPYGKDRYYLYGLGYDKEDWEIEVAKLKLNRILDL